MLVIQLVQRKSIDIRADLVLEGIVGFIAFLELLDVVDYKSNGCQFGTLEQFLLFGQNQNGRQNKTGQNVKCDILKNYGHVST